MRLFEWRTTVTSRYPPAPSQALTAGPLKSHHDSLQVSPLFLDCIHNMAFYWSLCETLSKSVRVMCLDLPLSFYLNMLTHLTFPYLPLHLPFLYFFPPSVLTIIYSPLHVTLTGMSAVNDLEGCTYMSQSLPFGGCKKSGYDRFAGPEGQNKIECWHTEITLLNSVLEQFFITCPLQVLTFWRTFTPHWSLEDTMFCSSIYDLS